MAAYLLTYFWEADAVATGVREAFLGQLGVRPTWRRHGLGGLLLAAALHSCRTAGYEAERSEHAMARAVDDALPDVPPTPPGFTLAPYATDWDEAVRQAHGEAFADHWGASPPD